MSIFAYGEKEINYLKKRDKRLGEAIDRIGIIERAVIPDLFEALCNSIVGQQISMKAADTIWERMKTRFGRLTPERILAAPAEEIQGVGISMRKVGYIKGIAAAVQSGELDIGVLYTLPDNEVCRRLSALGGVGIWTAEMMLLFSMQRPDVVSWGDLAIRRGMMLLYHHRSLTREQFERYRKRYSPYGSVASLYLWEISKGR